jgi:glycosyltransferase involved in cell wall biosynthesis
VKRRDANQYDQMVALLTIGMPVFNGERFIREALDSILAQTFTDFELLIADNASNDATPEIIAEYAAADRRIRCVRHDHNLGSAGNHNYLVKAATTPLFKWAASDDLHAPTHVERCITALEERPDLISAYTKTMRIDEHSRIIKPERYRLNTDADTAHVRFRNIIAKPHSCFSCFAVFRTEVIVKTACMQAYPASDRVFLAEIALHGRSAEVPEYLLFRRIHMGSHSAAPDASNAEKLHFWHGDNPRGDVDGAVSEGEDTYDPIAGLKEPIISAAYLELIDKVPLEAAERRRCRRELWITFRAAGLRSMLKRSVVFPVRKRMNKRRAVRNEACAPSLDPPLWSEYLEQISASS